MIKRLKNWLILGLLFMFGTLSLGQGHYTPGGIMYQWMYDPNFNGRVSEIEDGVITASKLAPTNIPIEGQVLGYDANTNLHAVTPQDVFGNVDIYLSTNKLFGLGFVPTNSTHNGCDLAEYSLVAQSVLEQPIGPIGDYAFAWGCTNHQYLFMAAQTVNGAIHIAENAAGSQTAIIRLFRRDVATGDLTEWGSGSSLFTIPANATPVKYSFSVPVDSVNTSAFDVFARVYRAGGNAADDVNCLVGAGTGYATRFTFNVTSSVLLEDYTPTAIHDASDHATNYFPLDTAGDLALLDDITLALVTDAGTMAAEATADYVAQADTTYTDTVIKAGSALQPGAAGTSTNLSDYHDDVGIATQLTDMATGGGTTGQVAHSSGDGSIYWDEVTASGGGAVIVGTGASGETGLVSTNGGAFLLAGQTNVANVGPFAALILDTDTNTFSIAIGRGAVAINSAYGGAGGWDVAIGWAASALRGAVAVGGNATAFRGSVAVGNNALAGTTAAVAIGDYATATDQGVAVGDVATGPRSGAAVGRRAQASDRGTAVGGALGSGAVCNGANYGVAVGYLANGANTNVAVGYQAWSGGGTNCTALGPYVSNVVNNSTAVRGTLYLDGGTGILYRASFGVGNWTNLTAVYDGRYRPLVWQVIADDIDIETITPRYDGDECRAATSNGHWKAHGTTTSDWKFYAYQ